MNFTYKQDKDTTNLSWRFKLDTAGEYWVMVYVWEDLESMRAAAYFERNDHIACFVGVPYEINMATGRRKKTSTLFGELHFVKDMYGAGVFAHELQHFVLAWIDEFDRINDEDTCLMVGKMTNEFWNKHYSYSEERPNV